MGVARDREDESEAEYGGRGSKKKREGRIRLDRVQRGERKRMWEREKSVFLSTNHYVLVMRYALK